MAITLSLTGWWIYIDLPISPKAVVVCVIIYNAAFGTSWGVSCLDHLLKNRQSADAIIPSLGTIACSLALPSRNHAASFQS